MGGQQAIEAAPLDQCIVLLAVAQAADAGTAPANPAELRGICNDSLTGDDTPFFGRLSEADVSRALNRLEAAGLVENQGPTNTSPTGKGRPLFAPALDADAIRETLAEDEDVASLVATTD